jgi:hypothetical protein
VSAGPGQECWFCAKGIDPTDREAVEIAIRNLWADDDDARVQYFFLHSVCAAKRLQGGKMEFRLDVFTDPN